MIKYIGAINSSSRTSVMYFQLLVISGILSWNISHWYFWYIVCGIFMIALSIATLRTPFVDRFKSTRTLNHGATIEHQRTVAGFVLLVTKLIVEFACYQAVVWACIQASLYLFRVSGDTYSASSEFFFRIAVLSSLLWLGASWVIAVGPVGAWVILLPLWLPAAIGWSRDYYVEPHVLWNLLVVNIITGGIGWILIFYQKAPRHGKSPGWRTSSNDEKYSR